MRTKFNSDCVLVNNPLFNDFHEHKPQSPRDFEIVKCHRDTFMPLNELWHSRLPECKNAFEGFFYGAKYMEKFYAVAWWSKPVARMLNGKGLLELRRLAICDDAPKNTATYMLKKMRKDINSVHPDIVCLISYQDTDVHHGTIYKADNWVMANRSSVSATGWKTRGSNRQNQSSSDKIRWEYRFDRRSA